MNWRTLAVAALGLLCTTGWTGAASEAQPVYEGHERDHPPQIDVTTTKSSHRW
jgi:hypothetical protein